MTGAANIHRSPLGFLCGSGKMAVGIKDIAKRANCSEATVSLALRGNSLVSEKTRAAILEIDKEIGYIPNLAARKLARRESGCLGLVIPDIENVFYASLVKHINAATKERGYDLIIAVSENNPAAEKKILSNMIENRVEGVVFVPMNKANPDPSYLSVLSDYHIPYVFCTDYYESLHGAAPVIMSDLEGGMYRLTKEVLRLGYQNPVYLTGDDAVMSLRLRQAGFERAAAETSTDSCIYRLETLNYRAAHNAIGGILKKRPDTDVFICVNDMIAAGTLNALSEGNYPVPQKGVAGFDNVIFSRISYPKISTVEQDIKTIAETSVTVLLEKKENKENIMIPTKIIKRESLKGDSPCI